MRRLADGLITYTSEQAVEAATTYPKKSVTAAPNALYYMQEMAFEESPRRQSIVYVGRFHPSKKVDLLVRAFAVVAETSPTLTLELVGDGVELPAIQALISKHRLEERVIRHGFVDNLDDLRAIYARALVSVSPGYVGLSITQSFAFGVPMAIADDEPHAPEIEAAQAGVNAAFFAANDILGLAALLGAFNAEKALWSERGNAIVADCQSRYSVESMAQGLATGLRSALRP